MPRQDRAAGIHHAERGARGQLGLRGQLVKPAKTEGGENHGLHLPGTVQQGIAGVDRGLPGDAADLVLADGKPARLHGSPEVRAVGDVHLLREGHGAAEDVARGVGRAQVGIPWIETQEVAEQRSAGGVLPPADLRVPRHVHEEHPRFVG